MIAYGKPVALIPPKHKGVDAKDASFSSPLGVGTLPRRLAPQTSTPRLPAGCLNFSTVKDPLRIDTSPAMLHQPVWPSPMLQQPWLSPVRNALETAKPTTPVLAPVLPRMAPALPLSKAAVAPTQNSITSNTNNFIFIKVEQNKCSKKSSSQSNDFRSEVCQNNNNNGCNASCQFCANCEVAAHSSSDEGIDTSFKASSSSLRSTSTSSSSSKRSSLDLSKDASASSNLSSANSSANSSADSLNSKKSSDSSPSKSSKCAVWRPW